MLTTWNDFDRTLAAMDELRRRMERAFDEVDAGFGPVVVASAWPRINAYDTGSTLVFKAEVPGLSEKDIRLSVNQDVLTLAGERTAVAPEGYSVHRQERPTARFARSFSLPSRVDAEKATATVTNGILTVTLPKAAESQPRQIAIRTA